MSDARVQYRSSFRNEWILITQRIQLRMSHRAKKTSWGNSTERYFNFITISLWSSRDRQLYCVLNECRSKDRRNTIIAFLRKIVIFCRLWSNFFMIIRWLKYSNFRFCSYFVFRSTIDDISIAYKSFFVPFRSSFRSSSSVRHRRSSLVWNSIRCCCYENFTNKQTI